MADSRDFTLILLEGCLHVSSKAEMHVQHLFCHPGDSSVISPSSSQHLGQGSGGFGWRMKANSRNAEVQERQSDRLSHMTNQHLQGWRYG